jgi:hypothetical protein
MTRPPREPLPTVSERRRSTATIRSSFGISSETDGSRTPTYATTSTATPSLPATGSPAFEKGRIDFAPESPRLGPDVSYIKLTKLDDDVATVPPRAQPA